MPTFRDVPRGTRPESWCVPAREWIQTMSAASRCRVAVVAQRHIESEVSVFLLVMSNAPGGAAGA